MSERKPIMRWMPLLVVGDVPETDAGRVQVGAPAVARLVEGQLLNGRVRYIAHDADPQTKLSLVVRACTC